MRGRLERCAAILEASYRQLLRLPDERRASSPTAQWLLDNHFMIREQLRAARCELRGGNLKRLPRAAGAAKDAAPEVFHLAQELVAGLDRKLDAATVRGFLDAYQGKSALTLAELWAVTPMLRLALLEKLSGIAARTARLRPEARPSAPHGQGAASESGCETDRAAIASTIASLRALALMDWKEITELTSLVERVLERDPAGVYGRMTFESRDYYRDVVARLARRSTLSETQVAEMAIQSAEKSPPEETRRHVGYHLLGRGRRALEKRVGYRPTPLEAIRRSIARRGVGFYFGGIFALWLLATGAAAALGWRMGAARAAGPVGGLLLLLLAAGGVGHFAVTMVDWLCSLAVTPKPLMRMDFSAGIPADCRTLVAVPTILTSAQGVSSLLRQLELRFLANRDDNLWLALLTDLPDADRETLPGDSPLVTLARQGIERMNRRYGNAFFLLHRPRTWNAQEGLWMGRERKRGKLSALTRLLRTGDASEFQATVGDLTRLASVHYVITLDTDTRLPRDAGRELAGCMAHPLNRPRIDAKTRLVTGGHAILQPRVTTTVADAHRSPFGRLLAGDAGTDPYTRQTSHVYQDLFDQGSFIGKGIYDVQAWEAAVEGRFPENRVLSHDLIEGCFARSGFVGDVELFESVPSRVLADASRRHRWIRGDWQIAAWLLGRVPCAQGRASNPLSWLSRGKIADNLRRSLTPVFLFALLLVGWTLTPAAAGFWTLLVAAIILGPVTLSTALCFLRKCEGKPWRVHLADEAKTCFRGLASEAVAWCILPYTAHYHTDAILRALWRLHVSRRRLLEWTTASDAEVRAKASCPDHYEIMWACPIASVGMAALLLTWHPMALWGAAPVLAAWLLGPMLAWAVSQPMPSDSPRLTDEERLRLGRWARQTWHYFQTHTNAQTHWLTPDNVQQRSRPVLAPRTSPTDLGMGLLAELAACDMGYQSPAAMLERTGRTLHSLLHLEQYRGHFYNWYDIRTLRPAEPRYVSSADSGNLWAALIVLHGGAGEMRDRPLVPPRLVDGVRETLAVVASLGEPLRRGPAASRFQTRLAQLQASCDQSVGGKASDACRIISRLRRQAKELAAAVPEEYPELREWTRALFRQCAAAHRDLCRLAFWTHLAAFATEGKSPGGVLDGVVLTARQRQTWEGLRRAIETLDSQGTLRQLPAAATHIAEDAESLLPAGPNSANGDGRLPRKVEALLWRLAGAARRSAADGIAQLRQISRVQDLCRQFCAMDFRFLYNAERKLLAIGYNASQQRRDEGCYDLLASEARLTSFLAVSHGQLPREHWSALRTHRNLGLRQADAGELVGFALRVSHAGLGHAHLSRDVPGGELPGGRAAPDGLRSSAGDSVGDRRKLLPCDQRRPRLLLSCFRRARVGSGPGPGREPGRRSLRLGVSHGRRAARSPGEPCGPGTAGLPEPERLLRRDRLHARPRPGRPAGALSDRDGAPQRDDAPGVGQRPVGKAHAAAVPQRRNLRSPRLAAPGALAEGDPSGGPAIHRRDGSGAGGPGQVPYGRTNCRWVLPARVGSGFRSAARLRAGQLGSRKPGTVVRRGLKDAVQRGADFGQGRERLALPGLAVGELQEGHRRQGRIPEVLPGGDRVGPRRSGGPLGRVGQSKRSVKAAAKQVPQGVVGAVRPASTASDALQGMKRSAWPKSS